MENKYSVPENLYMLLVENKELSFASVSKATAFSPKNAYETVTALSDMGIISYKGDGDFKVVADEKTISQRLICVKARNKKWTYDEFIKTVPEIDNPVYSEILIQLDEMGSASVQEVIKTIGHCAQFKLLENRGVIVYCSKGYQSTISAEQLRFFLELRKNGSQGENNKNKEDKELSYNGGSEFYEDDDDSIFSDLDDDFIDLEEDDSDTEDDDSEHIYSPGYEFEDEGEDIDNPDGKSDDGDLEKRISKEMSELMKEFRKMEEIKERAIEKYAIARKDGWDKIKYTHFGEYPQSDVLNPKILNVLRKKAGKLPTSKESTGWKPYGYKTSASDNINRWWYKDVEIDGKKYRGVYFTADRSYDEGEYFDCPREYYPEKRIYWFAFKPIRWRVLSETEESALLLCDMVIDAQPFDAYISKKECEKTINSWENSSLRKWLNDTFINTAFSEGFKEMLVPFEVSTFDSDGRCETTKDSVFLLSKEDILNKEYGFSSNSYYEDFMRKIYSTDYAVCKGLQAIAELVSAKDGQWWLRTPSEGKENVFVVSSMGLVNLYNNAHETSGGVVPAIVVKKD